MKKLVFALAALCTVLLSGCIVYDTPGRYHGGYGYHDRGWGHRDWDHR